MRIAAARDVTEERRTSERLALALEVGAMGLWDIDGDTGSFHLSDGLQRLYELEPGSFDETVESALELIHPADRDAVRAAFAEATERSGVFELEHRIVTRPGAFF